MVSTVHKPFENNDLSNDSCDMDIGCMHANENNTLSTGMDAEIMKSFVEIAKKTGQLSEIMEFPPIDHDSPIQAKRGFAAGAVLFDLGRNGAFWKKRV